MLPRAGRQPSRETFLIALSISPCVLLRVSDILFTPRSMVSRGIGRISVPLRFVYGNEVSNRVVVNKRGTTIPRKVLPRLRYVTFTTDNRSFAEGRSRRKRSTNEIVERSRDWEHLNCSIYRVSGTRQLAGSRLYYTGLESKRRRNEIPRSLHLSKFHLQSNGTYRRWQPRGLKFSALIDLFTVKKYLRHDCSFYDYVAQIVNRD